MAKIYITIEDHNIDIILFSVAWVGVKQLRTAELTKCMHTKHLVKSYLSIGYRLSYGHIDIIRNINCLWALI